MSQTVDTRGRSGAVLAPRSKNGVLKKIGVRDPKPEEVAPTNEAGKAEYEKALKTVEKQRDELVALKELADPSEINRLIEKAQGLVKTMPQYLAAKRELDKCPPIYEAQKKAAEAKKADQTKYNTLKNEAKTALTKLPPLADPAPLQELILTAEGLAERGQYAAAVAKLSKHQKVAEDVKTKAADENDPKKKEKYTARVKEVQEAITKLTTGDYKDLGDPEPLQNLLERRRRPRKGRPVCLRQGSAGRCEKTGRRPDGSGPEEENGQGDVRKAAQARQHVRPRGQGGRGGGERQAAHPRGRHDRAVGQVAGRRPAGPGGEIR